jgi:hypothetical protein
MCFINLGGVYADYQHVTATFTSTRPPAPPATLSVTKAGTGSGSVTSAPPGIDCGATCSASFALGTSVTLTATPDAASTFTGWTGACSGSTPCTLTLDQDKTATATFAANPKLTVTKAGTGRGTVVSVPSGIDCGNACSAQFQPGAQLSLKATADAQTLFTGWSGACTGTSASCALTLTTDATASATFLELPSATRLLAQRTKTRGCVPRGLLPDRSCSPGAVYSDASV